MNNIYKPSYCLSCIKANPELMMQVVIETAVVLIISKDLPFKISLSKRPGNLSYTRWSDYDFPSPARTCAIKNSGQNRNRKSES